MYRRMIITILGVSLAGGCERAGSNDPSTPADQQNQRAGAEDMTIETVPVAANIYMLKGRGGNIGVSVGPDGILIIDDKFAPLADAIRQALGKLDTGRLEYVLNTHHHGDHTGGNEVFGREATIIAHENVRKHLASADKPRVALPVITFANDVTVHFNGQTIHAVHFANGHTDGDSIIFFEEANVVHMGDHFFQGRFPFVDLDNGGDPVKLAENVRSVLARIGPEARIIPGHGELASRADLETYLAMLDETIASVREQMAQGKSLAEIQKHGVPAKWAAWGQGWITAEKWLETLHRALGAKQ